MNQKELLKDLANKIKSSNRSKEEIVTSLINANILIGDGSFSKDYKNLENKFGNLK